MEFRRKLFEQGLAAARTLRVPNGIYICPLCGGFFGHAEFELKKLTLEHVPPKSLGGKSVILTCTSCNSRAGHEVDSHAAAQQKLTRIAEALIMGKPGSVGRSTIEINGHAVRCDISVNNEGVTDLSILQNLNNPKRMDAFIDHMKALSTQNNLEGQAFNITPVPTYHVRKANISHLRTAFLACTAKFGYRFALNPVLTPIRQQITNPDREIWKPHWVTSDALDMQKRSLTVSFEEGLVIATFCGLSVLLPWHSHSLEHFTRRVTDLSGQRDVMLASFHHFSWPTSFPAILDHHNAEVRRKQDSRA